MSDIAIRVENLSKQYRIGKAQQRHDTLRDAVVDLGHRLSGRFFTNPQSEIRNPQSDDVFWALKDVSFEVKRGEVVGIIGRNGAGKSTLLKILSQITEPTNGRAEIHGRVASLLEVGTGFHPELTGRENIYLNGAILGMRREEINRQFDEIVAFAEIEKFLDTPVKRYSSGMYVRLAFAVAAHLEPEILLVDEVLAVGDTDFQKKCLRKIESEAKGGRTVLLVSHNLAAVQGICTTGILIGCGSIVACGDVQDVVKSYVSEMTIVTQHSGDLLVHKGREDGKETVLRRVEIYVNGESSNLILMGDTLAIKTSFSCPEGISNPRFGVSIENNLGQRVVNFSPSHQETNLFPEHVYAGEIICEIPNLALTPGNYYVTLIIANGYRDLDRVNRAASFRVEPSDVFGTGHAPGAQHGVFFQKSDWRFCKT